jgi:membrane fusion protein, multidrug efflux system
LAAQEGQPEDPRSWRRRIFQHPYVAASAVLALAITILAAVIWWMSARNYETTDDAFIDARTIPISSQVNGAIVDVPVTDN